ncbi:MAG TPA: tetratricopeptide repeat protein [Xanthobacteraceae bacterium]|nr:tetratricopeptide repeat protein [Xanthobacteraceae bacterium]
MPDTRSDRTLMALLALDDPSDQVPAAGAQAERLPTLDQRTDMFLRDIYGPNADVTAEMRSAARERILTAMAADLAENTADPARAHDPASPAVRGVADQSARRVTDGASELGSAFVRWLSRLLSPTADVFAMRAVRMAAVPLLALVIVGSIWTRTWIGGDQQTDGETSIASSRTASPPTTRSLVPAQAESAFERDLKREIAAAEAALGPTHPAVAGKLVDLAGLYRSEARYREAETLCSRALAIQEKALGPKHPDAVRAMRELARIYRAEGRTREADDLFARADQP